MITLLQCICKKSVIWLACLMFVFFTNSLSARSPRASISSLSTSDLKTLHDAIMAWMTQEMVDVHSLHNADVHTTRGFLPWHREHLIDLERYLTEQGLSQFVPLPAWNPASAVPAYFNGLDPLTSTPYNNTFPCTTCPYPSEDFTQFQQLSIPGRFIRHSPNPSGTNNDLCDYWNVALFSDDIEGSGTIKDFSYSLGTIGFHDYVHFRLGSNMGYTTSSASAIFWPWHAFIDDVWFDWECNCKPQNGTTINLATVTNAYDEVQDINITSNVAWSADKKIHGKVTIAAGGQLTINNGAVIEFLDEYYTNVSTGIVVERGSGGSPGGILIIEDGATLRGIKELGTGGLDGSPAKPYYNSMWPGIIVEGDIGENIDHPSQGKVILDGTGGPDIYVLVSQPWNSLDRLLKTICIVNLGNHDKSTKSIFCRGPYEYSARV